MAVSVSSSENSYFVPIPSKKIARCCKVNPKSWTEYFWDSLHCYTRAQPSRHGRDCGSRWLRLNDAVTQIIAAVINISPSYVNVLSHHRWGKASCRYPCEVNFYQQHLVQPMLLHQHRHI